MSPWKHQVMQRIAIHLCNYEIVKNQFLNKKNQAAKQGMDLGIILLHCALSLFFFVSLALCAWSCVCRTECSSLTFRSLAAIAFDHVQHSIP